MRLSELGLDPRVVEIFSRQGIEELYPPQKEAIPHILDGSNLVAAIPTASGKSLLAYIAMLKSVLEGGKALYIVPLRALASEKYDDLLLFEELGVKVAISMGDFDSSDARLEKFDIIVATSEKVDSLLRHRSEWIRNLTVVVADEVHLINDASRGPTLEVTLSRFKQINPQAQIIALSATIANSNELAEWLGAAHVKSEWRPVELREGVFLDGTIHFADAKKKKVPHVGDPIQSLVIDCIKEGGQTLVFVNTRRSSESLAERLSKHISRTLDGAQKAELKDAARSILKNRSEVSAYGEKLASCISGGAAFHNAALSNHQRKFVEKAFKSRIIKCIVATPTLAAGINLPAKRVVVRDLWRYDSNIGQTPLPRLEVKQMCGRAGRPQYDREGEAILLAKSANEAEEVMARYIHSETEDIYSKLGSMPSLRMHLLASIACGFASSEKELFQFINSTFFGHQGEIWTITTNIENTLEFLKASEFVTSNDGVLKATPFGHLTSNLYIDPLSSLKLKEALEASIKKEYSSFSILHAVTSTPDIIPLYMRKGDQSRVMKRFIQNEDKFLLKIPDEDEGNEFEYFLSAVKTAMLLEDWAGEVPESEIEKRYNIGPGDVHNKVETTKWLLHATCQLSSLFKIPTRRDTERLLARISAGIREELLELVTLENVGRVRARVLYNAGYKTIPDIQKAKLKYLASLPHIGPRIARSVITQAGGKIEVSDLPASFGKDDIKKIENEGSGTSKKQSRLGDF